MFDADGWFIGASFENICNGVMFGLGDPELIFIFYGNLAGDILTAKSFVGW